jgi:hypothetical protein
MKSRLVRVGIVLAVLIAVLIAGNPSEGSYLNEVSNNYGQVHGGIQFSQSDLLEMGESNRTSYLLFSTYEYRFGSIGVRYVGFLFSVFQVGSFREEIPVKDKKEEILA